MSDVIYKYGPFTTENVVGYAGEPVHVGYQNHSVYMWCRLSDDGRGGGEARLVATGEEFTGRYIGTVVMPSALVWHVVEV